MALFHFHGNGKPRKTKRSRERLITMPPPWASYDPVFETMDRIENDYHRFARRVTEQRRQNPIR
jgi:hypothetical protein